MLGQQIFCPRVPCLNQQIWISFPQTEQFFGAMIAHFTMTVLLVVIVLNVHHRANYGGRPPIWVRRLFLQRTSRFFKKHIASKNEVSQDSVTRLTYTNTILRVRTRLVKTSLPDWHTPIRYKHGYIPYQDTHVLLNMVNVFCPLGFDLILLTSCESSDSINDIWRGSLVW